MIRLILQGGLGNQMFEYAAGFALASRLETGLVLDTSMYEVYGGRAWSRPYELGFFRLTEGAQIAAQRKAAVRLLPKLSLYCRRHGKQSLGRWIFEADDWHNRPRRNYELFGYFANCHLFEDYREQLLKAFAFADKPNPANAALLASISADESVAVHIRRGDYLNATNASIFRHPDVAWYKHAMAEIEKQVTHPAYYFFSDDIEWVREQFGDVKNAIFVDVNHGAEAYNDMRLMSCCKHNIIANSTFSWWAAWLNTNPGKIVIAPARYYVDEAANERYRRTMLPREWKILY